ncbi:MAG: hypothetical protein M3325_14670 [Actinomycetota bacterium]|nr:hypothetical protein [Actinomycetota bacterium]
MTAPGAVALIGGNGGPQALPGGLGDPFAWVRALLDTSVVIATDDPDALEGGISAASLAELRFDVLVARDDDERAPRALRLGVVESTFEPLAINAAAAREWVAWGPPSRPAAAGPADAPSTSRFAATANIHHVPLLTRNAADR